MSYVSGSESERKKMLEEIGVSGFEDLIQEIPESLRLKRPLDLPPGKPEFEVISVLKRLSRLSVGCDNMVCFMGAGAYDHYLPAVVDTILSRSEFLTAYTPYQAEVSQGTLQTIYEFQSLVCRLAGMDIANASMYDGASAAAEAILLALSQTGNKKVYLAAGLHPTYVDVIRTYTSGMNLQIETLPQKDGLMDVEKLKDLDLDNAACVLIQSPNFYGLIENIKAAGEIIKESKSMYVVAANPFSLALLTPAGEAEADIAVGEMQVFGNAMNYGGPYVGYFAVKKKLMRRIPGRLAARTKDIDGNVGYCLTLQTREQHIRRDKATSNICTNQALCALAATVHLTLLGESGAREAATEAVKKAHYLADKLTSIEGIELVHRGRFFNEFLLRLPVDADDFILMMEKENIHPGVALSLFEPKRKGELLVCVTEKRTKEELDQYINAAKRVIKSSQVSVS